MWPRIFGTPEYFLVYCTRVLDMEKKSSFGSIILAVYLFLLIASQWPISMGTLKRLPATLDYVSTHFEFITQHPFLKKSLIIIPLAWLRAVLIVFLMPIGTLFILRRKNWARQIIFYGCIFLLLHTIFGFVTTYPPMVSRQMQGHLPGVQFANKFVGIGITMNKDFEVMFIQSILISVLCFLLPIDYLNRPKIKSQFQ